MLKSSLPLSLSLSMALPVCQAVETTGQARPSLVDFSPEQLAGVVVSVSRQQTRLAEAPASIYVPGQNLLRRSHPESGGPEARQLIARALQVTMAMRF